MKWIIQKKDEVLDLEAIMFKAQFTYLRSKTYNLFGNVKGSRNGRSSQLLYLYDYIAGKKVMGQQYVGTQSVDLAQIQGSLNAGRCRDFDGNFRLVNKHGQERLAGVAQALQHKRLPPISLVQVGDIYFVQDGHHRVSIALANEQEQIKANVTIMRVESNDNPIAELAYIWLLKCELFLKVVMKSFAIPNIKRK